VKLADIGIQSDAKDSICVRDPCIGRGRLRINAEGILYVLDSEDEDSNMDVDADAVGVATEGAATANGADLSVEGPPVAIDGAANGCRCCRRESTPRPSIGASGGRCYGCRRGTAPGPSLVAPGDASGMDLAPEVAAHLKEVLASMDPIYHEVFISMYKILVPIFFRP
jgi:hypothetical protein